MSRNPSSRARVLGLRRTTAVRLAVLAIALLSICIGVWRVAIWMPGKSYRGALPPLTAEERALQGQLQRDVRVLAEEIGERSLAVRKNMTAAATFLTRSLVEAGYEVRAETYSVENQTYANIEAERRGAEKPEEIVIVGAHYDSVYGSPGANDNGSGVAAMLAVARSLARTPAARTLRFVAFTNEEPPFFQTENMGSLVYAKGCRDRGENIVAVLSLETIGYYDDAPGSQTYPLGLLDRVYPISGNFISFVGNVSSGSLLRRAIASFRRHVQFPSEGAILPDFVAGAGWSDHWSFWQQGYPAIMLTDTAPFRYPYYHTAEDLPDKIDFDRFARVTAGVGRVVAELAGSGDLK